MKYLVLCLPFFGCSPSCEEQGGRLVQEGVYYVWQTVGSVTYPQPYPYYVCKKEKNT